ncbi:MAG TPA: alkaline phosphatase family protein [Thermoplasmata archaeon]|nr:alkaline phosphatase family protein [Thermoplasmata archaeon]
MPEISPTAFRAALIVLDGLGDRPHPETGGLSPVEAAATPNLDRLLAAGTCGRVVIIGPGTAPESDAGVLALLGYDPVHDSPGRGVLEAMGAGVAFGPGDVAFRMNFATLDGDGTILDSRVARSLSTGEAHELASALNRADLLADARVRASVEATVGHRGVLVLHPEDGSALSPEVSNADPFYEKVGGMGRVRADPSRKIPAVSALVETAPAHRTADAVNDFLARAGPVLAAQTVNARRALGGRPVANGLLLRNAGALPSAPPMSFRSKYGVEGTAITEMPVERGIARLLGMRDRFVGPMGRDRDRSLEERAATTLDALSGGGFVYVHLKGPDEPGHDGDAEAKREVVEALDRSFFGPFLQGVDRNSVRVAVTADHATPCILKGHSDDPVPLVLAGAGIPSAPSGAKFSERTCAAGALGELPARAVLPRLLGPSVT